MPALLLYVDALLLVLSACKKNWLMIVFSSSFVSLTPSSTELRNLILTLRQLCLETEQFRDLQVPPS